MGVGCVGCGGGGFGVYWVRGGMGLRCVVEGMMVVVRNDFVVVLLDAW